MRKIESTGVKRRLDGSIYNDIALLVNDSYGFAVVLKLVYGS